MQRSNVPPASRVEDRTAGSAVRMVSRENLIGLSVFLLIATGWSSAPFFRPELLSGETFIFHDNSYVLFAADQLLAGKVLFRDVFYQYGVLTAYVYAGWAALFGNTILSYWHLAQLLNCIGLVQLWLLLRRGQPVWRALVFAIAVLLPYFLIPGGLVESVGAYVGLERICLLSIALLWRPPTVRTLGSALRVGLLLGVMQWIKFGGAFMAAAILLAVDIWALVYARADSKRWVRWLKVSLVTLLGFMVLEGSLVALLYVLLPSQLAWEVLWPSWMMQNYGAYRYKSVTLLHWFNVNYFIGVQLPLVAGALVGLIFGGHLLLKPRVIVAEEDTGWFRSAGPALFLLIFFAVALLIYLPHMWVAMMYVWMILVPAALLLGKAPRWCLGVFIVLCLPAFLLSVKGLVPPETGLRKVHLANDTLWLSPETEARLNKLKRTLELLERDNESGVSDRPAILGFPMGSGLHHFFGYPSATRHAWFMSGFIRSREEADLLKSLDRTLAVVVFFPEAQSAPPSRDPSTWEYFSRPVFSQSTCLAMASRLDGPIEVDSRCWIFPVARSK